MFEGRLRWILAATCGLFAVFLCRVLYLQTSDADLARGTIEKRRHGEIPVPPRRGSIRDVDGNLLARDELGFDLLVDTRSLGAVDWECTCGRTLRTYESDPGPGEDDLAPLPAEPPASCRCGKTEFTRAAGGDREALAALLDLPVEELEGRLQRIRVRGWTAARRAARRRDERHHDERWRGITLRDWLGRDRRVTGGLAREAALEISLAPDRFPGFAVEARAVRRVGEGLDPATLSLLGRTGAPTPADDRRLHDEGLGMAEIRAMEVGRSGVERAFDRELRGAFGTERSSRDIRGHVVATESVAPVVDGEDLRLACSSWLNARAELLLGGRPGALVALDPRTGAVRAIAGTEGLEEGKPLAAGSALVPGSVLKVLTAIAALEGGVAPDEGEVQCRGDRGHPPCEHFHGRPGLRAAISGSCNAYFAATALRVGVGPLEDYARLLHLDRPYGLGLAGEGGGTDWMQDSFPPRQPWTRNDLANLGIGQGPVMLSPLQVGALFCSVANGGRPVVPHLVEGRGREPGAPVFSASTLAAVRAGLEDVVHIGTASAAGLQPFRAAGKTGTAQCGVDRETGRKRLNGWFAGYAPAEDPRIVVVVVFTDQGESGGRVAAPVAASFLAAWREWSAGR